jgi:predicted nucleotidyltransferase
VAATSNILLEPAEITEFCERWKIAELALFGSALREDFGPDSDVDFLVTFQPDASWSLLDHAAMEEELSQILGRKVDLVTRKSVERSRNWLRRREILQSAQPYYAAG